MHVCLLCVYIYIFMHTCVDLLSMTFLFYQIIGSFLQLIQSVNTNDATAQSVSLCLYVQNISVKKKRDFQGRNFHEKTSFLVEES